MNGFDLTQFGVRQQPVREQAPVQQPETVVVTPSPIQPEQGVPKTLDEALHAPLPAAEQDRLGKANPMLKHDLWNIDKFVEPGGLPRDKAGNILIKAPPSTEDDKKQINYHE